MSDTTKSKTQNIHSSKATAKKPVKRKRFLRKRDIDSHDIVTMLKNLYSCDTLGEYSNRDRSAFIQVWGIKHGKGPFLVRAGYPRDLIPFFENEFKAVPKCNYYITKNSFCRPQRRDGNLFGFHNIVIDIDDHETKPQKYRALRILEWEKNLLFNNLLFASKDDSLGVQIPPISAVVDTGRGLQVWYTFDAIAAKNKKAYTLISEALIAKIQKVCEKIHDTDSDFHMEVDVGASKNASGLCRIPGTTNSVTKEKAKLIYTNDHAKYDFFGDDSLSSVLSFTPLYEPDASLKTRGKKKKKKLVPVSKDGKPYPGTSLVEILERLFEVRKYSEAPSIGIRDLFLYIYYNAVFRVNGPEIAMGKTVRMNARFSNPLSERELNNSVGGIPKKVTTATLSDGSTAVVHGYLMSYRYIIDTLCITDNERKEINMKVPKTIVRSEIKKSSARAAKEKALREERNMARIMHMNHPELTIAELGEAFKKTRKWASACVNSDFEGDMAGAFYVSGEVNQRVLEIEAMMGYSLSNREDDSCECDDMVDGYFYRDFYGNEHYYSGYNEDDKWEELSKSEEIRLNALFCRP